LKFYQQLTGEDRRVPFIFSQNNQQCFGYGNRLDNKTDWHVITEILLKVALNTITLTPFTTQVVSSNPAHDEVYSIQHFFDKVCQ